MNDRTFNRGIDPTRPYLGPGFGPVVVKVYNPDYGGIQPRIGLAYNLFGKGKTVLRAGFAKMEMAPTMHGTVMDALGLSPSLPESYALNTAQTKASGLAYPLNATNYVSILTALQASGVVSSNLPVGSAIVFHNPNPYSFQWMFGIQQALPWRMTLETDYNGNRGLNEVVDEVVNRPNRITGVAPNPTVGTQGLISPYGMSKYASLQVTLRKALSNGLSFSTAFTYARVSAVGSADFLTQVGSTELL